MRLIILAAVLLGGFYAFSLFQTSGQKVSAADYGDDWPFTVSEGYIDCKKEMALTFESGGVVYALNGVASAWLDAEDLDSIWLPDPKYPDFKLKKDYSDIFEAAERLC